MLKQKRWCAWIDWSSPSRDKASRMLRQAVARSAMDCHSSSVESVVSDRTGNKTRGAATDFSCGCRISKPFQPLNPLEIKLSACIVPIVTCRARDCKKTKQGHSLGSFPGRLCNRTATRGRRCFKAAHVAQRTKADAGSVLIPACRLRVTGFCRCPVNTQRRLKIP